MSRTNGEHTSTGMKGENPIIGHKRLEEQVERAQSALREAEAAVAGLLEELPSDPVEEAAQSNEETAGLAEFERELG